jgi:hypothetical protein
VAIACGQGEPARDYPGDRVASEVRVAPRGGAFWQEALDFNQDMDAADTAE